MSAKSSFDRIGESAVRLTVGLGALLLVGLLAVPAMGQDSTDDVPSPIGTGSPAHVARAPGICPAPLNVCYYDLGAGQGNPNQVNAITTAGHTPVDVVVPDAATLADCDVLFAQNPSNGGFGAEWMTGLGDIDAAVLAGMALVFHDRRVDGAPMNVPGLAANCVRETSGDTANIDIVNAGTVTAGLDDSSLDGGTLSSHGYCDSLPAGALNILSRTVTSESVTFSYPYGDGRVVYSTIPLDFYLDGLGPNPPQDDMVSVYAPNVVAYAGEFCEAGVPTLPGGAKVLLLLALLALPMFLSRHRQRT